MVGSAPSVGAVVLTSQDPQRVAPQARVLAGLGRQVLRDEIYA
jgi:hypothetical protein